MRLCRGVWIEVAPGHAAYPCSASYGSIVATAYLYLPSISDATFTEDDCWITSGLELLALHIFLVCRPWTGSQDSEWLLAHELLPFQRNFFLIYRLCRLFSLVYIWKQRISSMLGWHLGMALLKPVGLLLPNNLPFQTANFFLSRHYRSFKGLNT